MCRYIAQSDGSFAEVENIQYCVRPPLPLLFVRYNYPFMISNERPSAFGRRPYGDRPPRPHVEEDTLKTETIQIERKTFIFTLKENQRGRFLRISEVVNGRRDNVIIPATGLDDFLKMAEDMVKAAAEIPGKEQ